MHRTLLSALALSCLLAKDLPAEDAFEMPVSGEILPGWVQADGTRVIGLRMKLAPGWKTYWRSPGDAGIPPTFDWRGSENLKGVGITWPAPGVFLTAGMRTIGYEGDVVLPIALAPTRKGEPISLQATVDMGVCKDICIPHRMTLEAFIDDQNTKPTPAIAAALAARPYSAQDADVSYVTCALRPTEDGLAITATLDMPAIGRDEIVIIEPGQPGVWMSETQTERANGMLVAVGEMMLSDGSPIALDRDDVTITVLGQNHAVEIRGCDPG